MGYVQEEFEKAIGKKWKKTIIIVAVIIFIYLIAALLFSFWPFSSIAEVVQKVTSPEAIIGNYEWFFDMKGQIDATKIKYLVAKKEGMSETPGIYMVLSNMIAEYNSRSQQITRNLWKEKTLPYKIIIDDYIKGEN